MDVPRHPDCSEKPAAKAYREPARRMRPKEAPAVLGGFRLAARLCSGKRVSAPKKAQKKSLPK